MAKEKKYRPTQPLDCPHCGTTVHMRPARSEDCYSGECGLCLTEIEAIIFDDGRPPTVVTYQMPGLPADYEDFFGKSHDDAPSEEDDEP